MQNPVYEKKRGAQGPSRKALTPKEEEKGESYPVESRRHASVWSSRPWRDLRHDPGLQAQIGLPHAVVAKQRLA